ncbi:MAG: hypothetical protein WAT81_00350 [Candidatus Moraniibacteriota bacterium]
METTSPLIAFLGATDIEILAFGGVGRIDGLRELMPQPEHCPEDNRFECLEHERRRRINEERKTAEMMFLG